LESTSKTLAPSDANRIDVSNPMRLINQRRLASVFTALISMAHPPAPVTIVDWVMLGDKLNHEMYSGKAPCVLAFPSWFRETKDIRKALDRYATKFISRSWALVVPPIRKM
jgi:hypothetical protein